MAKEDRKELTITIDGPAGSGKSTTAQKVAQALDYQYLDSGALYRAITLYFLRENIDIEATFDLQRFLDAISLDMRYENNQLSVWLNGENVTDEIRAPRVSSEISSVAADNNVRKKVNEILHRLARKNGCVAEGRDMGSVVFPNADLKIFMSASLEERSKRRQKQFDEKGIRTQRKNVKTELEKRDLKDSTREHDPLIRPEDSVYLDNSSISFDEQVQFIIDLARQRGA